MQENGSALIPEAYREATTPRFSPVKRIAIIQFALPTLAAGLLLTGCKRAEPKDRDVGAPEFTPISTFLLNPEVNLSELQKSERVDVNLGHSPEVFIKALWKQFTGELPSAALVENYKGKFRSGKIPRRIDLAIELAQETGADPLWTYTDPWREQLVLEPSQGKALARDIGAVFMFFFTSPEAPNGGPGWANNHVPGMREPNPLYQFTSSSNNVSKDGLYHPENAGFWYRELKDARHAGLEFALLNVYGPDLQPAQMEPLRMALKRLRDEHGQNMVKLGMFDDTWTWGQPWFGPFWEQKPDCLDIESTAKLLYEAKWQPFFKAVPRDHWYLVNKRPMIYFYNSNTLQNRENFHRVLPVMKALFMEDFGVEPWVAVDTAFNYHPAMKEASDSQFKWYTLDLPAKYASETREEITLSHAMPRWDPISRGNSNTERGAREGELLAKDDTILKLVLNETHDSDILVLATWNDLGEGTGINRCYDYYWNGEWKQPNHFMDLIRRSQDGEILNVSAP
jgi:hypothetical protein